MLRDADVLSLLLSRQPGYSLEQPFYQDPGLYDADLRHIWYKDWLMTAVSAELPKTGSYVTRQIGDYSVIVVRGADGVVRVLPQFLPPSGQPDLFRRQGQQPQAGLPLPPVDLRTRWPSALCARDGRRISRPPNPA